MINTSNLKMLRAKYDMSQQDVADTLNITVLAYRQKESGFRKFTLPESKKLSEIFGMSIEAIFFTDIIQATKIK